jgi:tetratricopeptide (TPR) repeat protein
LDGRHEGARQLLGKLKLAGGSIDGALNALGPLVDGAIAARDFARAAGYLEPLLEADSAHIPTIRKLAEVREAEGNAADAAELRLVLARDAEQHNDTDGAIAEYRRVLKAAPAHAQAMTRMAELAPGELSGTPPPSAAPAAAAEGAFEVQEVVVDVNPADEGPVHAPQPVVPSMEFDAPPAAPAAAEPDEAPPAPAAAGGDATLSDREIETLVVESEVFARYGLTDKAVERLRSLTRRRPDLLKARERLVELMAETKNAALSQEAAALAEAWRAAGRVGEADLLLARHGLAPVTSSFPPPSASTPASASDFEEFDIDIAPAPSAPPTFPTMETEADEEQEPVGAAGEESGAQPAEVSQPDDFFPEAPNETIRLSTSEIAAAAAEAAAMAERSAPKPAAPIEGDFVSYEELGSLLQDEMQRAGAEKPAAAPPPPVIDEQNLFADERQFFNLAEELEKELADEVAPRAPDVGPQEGDVSLEEIFREFKKGVEQQLSAEDYETHFNLGIAYKEMGLTDEAIGEFQLASKDPKRAVECCSMLGLCFLEKGMPQLAVKWYRKGLEAPGVTEAETVGLLYDLGCVYQSTGDTDLAYRTFLEVYGLNTNYRDVSQRVKELETVRKE